MNHDKDSKVAADMAAFMITASVLFFIIAVLFHWIEIPDGEWAEHWEHNGVIGD